MIDLFSFLKNPRIKFFFNLFNKSQNNNQSQVITNSVNNPTFNLNLINNKESEPYILTNNSDTEKLINEGRLDESQKPWHFDRSNINRIVTKDGKYVKWGEELWLVSSKKI